MAKKIRTQQELLDLNRGDIIRHVGNSHSYVVMHSSGDALIAVDVVEATNPDEWEVVYYGGHRPV